jgi:hypothetical protein
LQRWLEDLTAQIQVLPKVGLSQDNIADFVELLLVIGFLSLQSCLHFRVHHQVSVDASGGQQTPSHQHSASISSVRVL